jgi:hypothetical protein
MEAQLVEFKLADGTTVEALSGGFVVVLPDGRCGMVESVSSIRPVTVEEVAVEEESVRAAENVDEW